ncbi:hypothetical protein WH95_13375 [Kiloniella litopenaei]|uniref:Uncharacterized protein n=1 Tax=Kiloniella litopenaei TaxID=1549748 RepID=A0A0M2R921_9PROT|nr:hypothetical protein WH95_13375 [Kiloniella litopenaei]
MTSWINERSATLAMAIIFNVNRQNAKQAQITAQDPIILNGSINVKLSNLGTRKTFLKCNFKINIKY